MNYKRLNLKVTPEHDFMAQFHAKNHKISSRHFKCFLSFKCFKSRLLQYIVYTNLQTIITINPIAYESVNMNPFDIPMNIQTVLNYTNM